MNLSLVAKVLRFYQLDDTVCALNKVKQSHVHEVYHLLTTKADYIIKVVVDGAVNPRFSSVIQAPLVAQLVASDVVAKDFSSCNVSAISAYVYNQSYCRIDGRYYLLYPFVPGEVLAPQALTTQQLIAVGRLVYQLHHCCLKGVAPAAFDVFTPSKLWLQFVDRYFFSASQLLQNSIQQSQYYTCDPVYSVISHRDITPGNIVWQHNNCRLIDWELAGWIDPGVELLAAAIDFSLADGPIIDRVNFHRILSGYAEVTYLQNNIQACFYSMINIWLQWVSYLVEYEGEAKAVDALAIVLLVLEHKKSIYEAVKDFDAIT